MPLPSVEPYKNHNSLLHALPFLLTSPFLLILFFFPLFSAFLFSIPFHHSSNLVTFILFPAHDPAITFQSSLLVHVNCLCLTSVHQHLLHMQHIHFNSSVTSLAHLSSTTVPKSDPLSLFNVSYVTK